MSLDIRTALNTPTDIGMDNSREIAAALNAILADTYALYIKTKNFHWHMSGPHFRDFHLLLDEQASQILAATDDMAERVRKIGGKTIRSIGQIAQLQRIIDNDEEFVTPQEMLEELASDNRQLAAELRELHGLCSDARDYGTTQFIEPWIDEAEKRAWFLFECTRRIGREN
jgi:starvation-inducible DNA-binding protein